MTEDNECKIVNTIKVLEEWTGLLREVKDGKQLQLLTMGMGWEDTGTNYAEYALTQSPSKFRIKPEPVYEWEWQWIYEQPNGTYAITQGFYKESRVLPGTKLIERYKASKRLVKK